MKWNRLKERVAVALGAAGLVVSTGIQAAPPVDITQYEGAITADDLFVVDCLLPGQVRQLGQNFTYVAPRRPIRAPARECARRGGEYVAYDRANMETALKVWMQAAEGGDANAQVHVGEIYEKGLGVEPDYAAAAVWYEKAAEQGESRAMINLGALYESGRGVAQDMTRAMNWYRQAAGLTEGFLEYTTEDEMAQRRAMAEEAERLRAEVVSLTEKLESTEKTMARRERDLRRARDDLNETLAELAKTQAASGRLSAEDQRQMDELQAENQRLRDELSQNRQRQITMQVELEKAREFSASAELELARTQSALEQLASLKKKAKRSEREELASQESELRRQLEQAQARLQESQSRQKQLETELTRRNEELSSLQLALGSRQEELSEARQKLADSDETLELLLELEAEIADKEKELAEYESTTQELLAELVVAGGGDGEAVAALDDESIRMISPEVGNTRGVRSVTLFSDVNEYELIGRVAPKDQLIAFKVNDQDRIDSVDDNGLFKVRVTIGGNDTPVAIEAVRRDGIRSSESFVIQKDLPDPVAMRETSKQFRGRLRSDLGNFYALVIGNNDYVNHDNLSTARNDAQGVADVLQNRYGYDVRLLINATRDQMVIALANLARSLEKNDNLLIYYAGHGVVDEDGEGYWLPVDASANHDKSWIGNAQISDFIAEMSAKHVLVVADSCYSGTLSGTSIRPIPLDVEDQDLLFISRVKARTVLTSGGLQPVLDDGGSGHSIFGGAFIRAISSNDDVMEGYRLFEAVGQEVETRSKLARVPQDPEYTALKYAGHEGSEFFFLPSAQFSQWQDPESSAVLLAAR